jgi:hypothetical protein
LPARPPVAPPLPGWARAPATLDGPDEAGFFAGAALAVIDPIARADHPLGSLWRQRLALESAASLVRHQGRTEDAAALRDAWYLRRAGDDPGPAGRILQTWRRLGDRSALRPNEWPAVVPSAFDLARDEPLGGVLALAADLAKAGVSPVSAAARIAAATVRQRPDAEALALWLADAVLALRMTWPAAVPLLATQIARRDLRAAARLSDDAWARTCGLAYGRAAAAAADLYAELARRAERLLSAAPKLRSKDAEAAIATLLSEDAQAAAQGELASARSGRRLFERLVALGAVRELTGRTTFRLYGL